MPPAAAAVTTLPLPRRYDAAAAYCLRPSADAADMLPYCYAADAPPLLLPSPLRLRITPADT